MTKATYDYGYVNDYMQRVIDWNIRAGNAPERDTDPRINQIALQTQLVAEELKELVDAVKSSDMKEQFDAVCDLIVVGSYLATLASTPIDFKTPVVPPLVITNEYATDMDADNPPIDRLVYVLGAALVDAGVEVVWLVGTVVAITQSIWHMYARDHGEEALKAYMEEVLSTNDAKFLTDYTEATAGLAAVREKYKGKYDNVVVKRCPAVTGDTREYYCYRADSGKGKILKPANWKEPAPAINI